MKTRSHILLLSLGALLVTGSLYASSSSPYVSMIQTTINNNTDYPIVIQPRKSDCQRATFRGVAVEPGQQKTMHGAISSSYYGFMSGFEVTLSSGRVSADEGTSAIETCSSTYFVYAQTEGGSRLIGIMELAFGYRHLPGHHYEANAICHFMKGGSYTDTQNRHIPGDISASVHGASQCGENGEVTFNFN